MVTSREFQQSQIVVSTAQNRSKNVTPKNITKGFYLYKTKVLPGHRYALNHKHCARA
jgi:hypothetical protein